jgi:hypothetical protein
VRIERFSAIAARSKSWDELMVLDFFGTARLLAGLEQINRLPAARSDSTSSSATSTGPPSARADRILRVRKASDAQCPLQPRRPDRTGPDHPGVICRHRSRGRPVGVHAHDPGRHRGEPSGVPPRDGG